jgi:hypothetical protein
MPTVKGMVPEILFTSKFLGLKMSGELNKVNGALTRWSNLTTFQRLAVLFH